MIRIKGWAPIFPASGRHHDPLCKGTLVIRFNRRTEAPFWGCSEFPRGCRFTEECAHDLPTGYAIRLSNGPDDPPAMWNGHSMVTTTQATVNRLIKRRK